jgi:hypothetical protein
VLSKRKAIDDPAPALSSKHPRLSEDSQIDRCIQERLDEGIARDLQATLDRSPSIPEVKKSAAQRKQKNVVDSDEEDSDGAEIGDLRLLGHKDYSVCLLFLQYLQVAHGLSFTRNVGLDLVKVVVRTIAPWTVIYSSPKQPF